VTTVPLSPKNKQVPPVNLSNKLSNKKKTGSPDQAIQQANASMTCTEFTQMTSSYEEAGVFHMPAIFYWLSQDEVLPYYDAFERKPLINKRREDGVKGLRYLKYSVEG
jgi:hypothetical protein